MEWYALFVETGKEELIRDWLNLYFHKSVLYSIVPKKKVAEKKNGNLVEVLKKLFPGYVLIYTKMTSEVYYKIKSNPNFIKILGNGDYYTKIPQIEIEPILSLLNDRQILECSQIITEDSDVKVISGPLLGMEAIIKKINKRKRRAKILLNFHGTEKLIDVGIEVLENVHPKKVESDD